MTKNLAKFLALPWTERLLLLEAWAWLIAARLLLWLVPFRFIAPRLGKQVNGPPPAEALPPAPPVALQIGPAVERMARHTPWGSPCLPQAVAAKAMLRRRGLVSTLYLGMRKDKSGAPQAHAWLTCGQDILTGAADHETFTVLSFFQD